MAKKFYIYKTANCFTFSPKESEDSPSWAILNIGYGYDYHTKGGIIGVEFIKSNLDSHEIFSFGDELNGEYHHIYGYGKEFNLCWNIRDNKTTSRPLHITGGDYTNDWNYRSIASGITKFLNELHQFQSIDDYILYKNFSSTTNWDSKDICDKIISLAEIIKLYKNYIKINPSLPFIKEFDNLIQKTIKNLIQSTD